jgi:hypothetical protein
VRVVVSRYPFPICVRVVNPRFACPGGRGHAQGMTSDVLGTVTDSTGAAIPGAMVRVQNTGTHIIAETKTGDNGAYTITHLHEHLHADSFPSWVQDLHESVVEPGRRRPSSSRRVACNRTTARRTGALSLGILDVLAY